MTKTRIAPAILAAALMLSLGGTLVMSQEKGGGNETGPYDVVPGWPQNYCGDGFVIGATAGIFAESPDRVFIFSRGCLPVIEDTRGPAENFIPIRNAANFDLSQADPARHPRWDHIVDIVDRNGRLVESWEQHNKLFVRPHRVLISPYDPERHVWLVDDGAHSVYKFTNDGRKLVMTLGEFKVPGDDERHFARPTEIAWLPDGTFFVTDGYTNTRVVKFDRNGKFLLAWGMNCVEPNETRPGYMNTVHAIAIDKNRRVYISDRANARAGVRRERHVPRCVAEHQEAVLVPDVCGPAPVDFRRHDAEASEVRPGREAPLLVGHVRTVPWRLLGSAPVQRRQ
jgi:hypothetical protein